MNAEAQAVARERVRSLLGAAPGTLAVDLGDDEIEIELLAPDDLDAGQVGFAISPEGESLVGPAGFWQPEWFVIGLETLLGDPNFVDLDDPALPVMTAMHGMGRWDPDRIADSLEVLLQRPNA